MTKQTRHVLGFHPSSRGFGWILFENERTPFDWGAADVRGEKNAGTLMRLKQLLDKYKPDVLAIEAFDDKVSRRSPRIRALYRIAIARAHQRRIAVRAYSRTKIARALLNADAATREDIANAVAGQVDALRPQLPKPRKLWEGEKPGMALFSAAACALTGYRAGR